MENLLFCVNQPEKIAKRHCKKCDQDLCNSCVFDSHIEHHKEIEKISYSIDYKKEKITKLLSKNIELIIDQNLKDLKPKIYKLVLEKTEEYIKGHKNLQLKLAVDTDKKQTNATIKPKSPVKPNNEKQSQEKKESEKKEIKTNTTDNSTLNQKIFDKVCHGKTFE